MKLQPAYATATFLVASILSILPVVAAYSEQYNIGFQPPTMEPGPVLRPAPDSKPISDDNNNNGQLTISDVLPKSRNINIFASLTRDVSIVANRLESTSATANTTLLAPLNSVMQGLPRKPWEDRPDDTSEISAARNEDKAAQNLERFVTEHVVPTSPWKAGKQHSLKTLGGQTVWWEDRNGQKIIHPGEVVVDSVLGQVGNGEIWALKGVINYA